MIQFEFTVKDPNGLHARPAGQLVKEAQKYKSALSITKGEKSADLRRLFAVMGLAVKQGETVVIKAEGEDEQEAADFIQQFLAENF